MIIYGKELHVMHRQVLNDQNGHADQRAGIGILCVKHTLSVVAGAAAQRVKLG